MTASDGLMILVRWVHILAAAILVGGGLFYLLGLRSGRKGELTSRAIEGFQKALAERARPLGICMALLVISGAIVAFVRLSQPETSGLYFGILGGKLFLAAVTLSLVHRLACGEKVTDERPSPSHRRGPKVFRRLLSLGRWRPLPPAGLMVALGGAVFLLSIILRAIFENSLTKG